MLNADGSRLLVDNLIGAEIRRDNHDIQIVLQETAFRVRFGTDQHLFAVHQGQHVKISRRIILNGGNKALIAKGEIKKLMLSHHKFFPVLSLPQRAPAAVNQVLVYPVRRTAAIQHLISMIGMNGAWVSIQILADVIVHFIGIGAHRQASDLQNQLVLAGGVDGSRRDHHLRTGL